MLSKRMSERTVFTFQTRLALSAPEAAALDAYAQLYGRAERSLFAAMRAGGALNDLKRAFLPRFGITARHFNALRVGVEGKIDSIKARRPELIAELQGRIKRARRVLAKIAATGDRAAKAHQKKRRLHILETKLKALQADNEAEVVHLCFGSRKLFRAQFDLAANGYASHAEWKAEWQRERASQFFVLGSQDETAGNQSCQADLATDGTLNIKLRLPDALQEEHGKHVVLTGIRFAYGMETILDALASSQRIQSTTKAGKTTLKRVGRALSYRFVRDAKGWRVFVSCEAAPVATTTRGVLGAVGVDINADHLALSEIDRFGNPVAFRRIDLRTHGATTEQAKAMIGDAAVAIVEQAKAAGKPLVIEQLDFAKKKAELEGQSPRQARMLSSFAYNKVVCSLKAAAFRAGVEVREVNPAYTSVIGAVNLAQRNGVSVHMAAAGAIARRGLGLSERCPKRMATVPVRDGGHVTFSVPARNRSKHVWSQWAKLRTSLRAAHVAHGRSGIPQGLPAPLAPATRPVCANRPSTVRLRGANRQQHCSADVMADVPW